MLSAPGGGALAVSAVFVCAGCSGVAMTESWAPTIEGVYRWSTEREVRGAWDPNDDELVPAPNMFTLTLDDGDWMLTTTASPGRVDSGTYAVVDGRLELMWLEPESSTGLVVVFEMDLHDVGDLALDPTDPMDPDIAFVFASETLTRIADDR